MNGQPAIVDELLDGPYPCALTTLDARRQSPTAWSSGAAGPTERITVNAADGLWLRNLRRDPRLSLVVVDTENILRHVNVQGAGRRDRARRRSTRTSTRSPRSTRGGPTPTRRPADVPRFRIEIEPLRIRTLDLSPP